MITPTINNTSTKIVIDSNDIDLVLIIIKLNIIAITINGFIVINLICIIVIIIIIFIINFIIIINLLLLVSPLLPGMRLSSST